MKIKRIFAELNGQLKTFKNRDELVSEIKKLNSLNLILKIEFEEKTIELSILSSMNFIVTGEIQDNI